MTKAHVKELLAALREQDKAPRTIRNILSTLRSLYHDLIDEEIVGDNPCNVHRKHLGPAGDKDPEWRATALYKRDEIIRLISHPELPPDRRVLYAISFLTGLRLGEVAGTCWRHWQRDEPLSKLVIAHSYKKSTKTDTPRDVPVHPLLELVLQGWHDHGFEAAIGWAPRPDDPLIPSPRSSGGNGAHRHRDAGSMRTKDQVGKRFCRDLEIVGIPHRRLHDARRTFISLAQADGAQREHLLPVTHSSRVTRAAFDLYTTIPWATRSAAVASFRPVPPSNYSELSKRILAEMRCYERCYVARQVPEITGEKLMEAPGVESVASTLTAAPPVIRMPFVMCNRNDNDLISGILEFIDNLERKYPKLYSPRATPHERPTTGSLRDQLDHTQNLIDKLLRGHCVALEVPSSRILEFGLGLQ